MVWMIGLINVSVVATVFGPVIGFIGAPLRRKRSKEWVAILDESELADNETRDVTFEIPVRDGYLDTTRRYSIYLKRAGNTVTAFDPACTHLGCRVELQASKNRYFCPCHGGIFDLDGNVISGPPPTPLLQHKTKIEGGKIWLEREV